MVQPVTSTAARAGQTAGRGAQERYTHHYTELLQRVKESGLLRRRYGYYWTKMSLTVAALGGLGVGFGFLGNSWFQLLLAGVVAVVFAQFAFLGHDAAHRQIFRTGWANEWAGLVHGTLFGGLSYGWWQGKHTRHHGNPNKQDKDPDLDSKILAFTPDQRAERRGLGAFLADRQGYFFFPLLLLEGVNLHFHSVRRIFGRRPMKYRWWEIGFLAVRLGGYVTALFLVMSPGKAVLFLGIQLAAYGLYMGGAFTPNHTGMPIVPASLKVDFLRRQVLMSRNVTGGWVIHFLLGGLNYQIEHHLFPNMPRPNLRHVQPMVREVCTENRIPYTEKRLLASYRIVLRYLNAVGLRARDPFGCPLAAQLRAPR
ncbi:MAG: acyl-CoA desaturase [Acidothermales bacterium]|nr:acyl-CoA desaturase [Acidothermales bacterium]